MPKDNKKEKRHFFKDFKAELKKVIWPTPKQLVNNTVAVITIVLIIAVIVFVLDFTFEKMNTYGINKLKSMVETSNSVEENISEETDANTEVQPESIETEVQSDSEIENSEVAE